MTESLDPARVEKGMEKHFWRVMFLAAVALGIYVYSRPGIGFSDAQVISIQKEIAVEFKKRDGIENVDATMVRESARKLTGFATITITGMAAPITKSCTATMAEDGANSLWQCQ
jgi:hypothetical protein